MSDLACECSFGVIQVYTHTHISSAFCYLAFLLHQSCAKLILPREYRLQLEKYTSLFYAKKQILYSGGTWSQSKIQLAWAPWRDETRPLEIWPNSPEVLCLHEKRWPLSDFSNRPQFVLEFKGALSRLFWPFPSSFYPSSTSNCSANFGDEI